MKEIIIFEINATNSDDRDLGIEILIKGLVAYSTK